MKPLECVTWIVCLALCGFTYAAVAQIDRVSMNEANVAPPKTVVDLQNPQDTEIDYMIEHYSQPELAKYAIEMYKTEVRNAKLKGIEPPEKPTREMLEDKQKIGEYLRNFYKFSY